MFHANFYGAYKKKNFVPKTLKFRVWGLKTSFGQFWEKAYQDLLSYNIVCTLLSAGGGLDKTSTFRGDYWERGGDILQGGIGGKGGLQFAIFTYKIN